MLLRNINNICGSIAVLSTYPPTESSLSMFTQDLITAIDSIGIIDTSVIAVSSIEDRAYNSKVIAEIKQHEHSDYLDVARKLNESNIDLLIVEHDYEIFGGEQGEYILDLINNLEIPVVTTLHTILLEPDLKQRSIINTLGKKSANIITMAKNTKNLLQTVYGVDPRKIEVIHHGVTKKLIQSRESLKKKYGYENMQVISTFGLIGPDKGIEHGIEAVSKVVKDKKDVVYLILGQMHPALDEKGLSYRNRLDKLVEKLDLGENVKFVDKYLSKDEIVQYLQMSDIYMTPYTEEDQAVSGTMAYAVAYGRAIVSTPYLYAKEMLSERRGMLAEFNNPDSIADCIKFIFQNPYKKAKMERDTIKIGRTMYWDKIAKNYIEVFLNVIKSTSNIEVV